MGLARAALWLLAVLALPGALLALQPRSAAFAHSAVVAHEQTGLPAAHCSGNSYHPDPTPVAVDAVPIVVASTTDEYFVLYATFDVDGTELELPVLVKRGEAGTTTLAENIEALPPERYTVEQYLIADPADVDGDCVDDITELASGYPVSNNPVNAADGSSLGENLIDGAVGIPDQATFDTLANPRGGATLKVILFSLETNNPGIFFINTNTYLYHVHFLYAFVPNTVHLGILVIHYKPGLEAPDGSMGAYYWDQIQPLSFNAVERTVALLAATAPGIAAKLYAAVWNDQLGSIQPDLDLYRESRIALVFEEDFHPYPDRPLSLNEGVGYGLLRVMEPDERPHPRDVVIYETLPNDLPRVAGVISTVYQTPLSHVNLRAAQNDIPNAYIPNALADPDISPLIGGYVRYEVDTSWKIRAATLAEVNAHYDASRPATTQTPQRDLSITEITPLSEISFEDWDAFGVKAANLAVLRTLGFPEGTVPDGFAIPFYFYDEFMKANGFHERIEQILADPHFQSDFDVQDDMLDDLRDAIEDAETPAWITEALTAMHATFPEGTSLRYRSSTNNEDLPNFNGAGLYDSKTQDPDETAEDGIDKSLKGVFASLWTFRAFAEREFHRIDHTAAAMGVLVHPNYSDELANGVAVSFDHYDPDSTYNRHYVNTQLGEDLVTNPEAYSKPEELVLDPDGTYRVLFTSNLVPPGELLMSDAQIRQLRQHLDVIRNHFEQLYDPAPDEPFAMEIEFKITSDNVLAIKQARPWVFGGASTVVEPPVIPAVTVGFAASSYTVAEGESVPVVVSLSADPERTLTIPLTPREQGGASSADHSSIPASVTFASGVTSQMFNVSAAADGEADAGESVWIGFGALPTGVTVGGTPATTVAITDSDGPVLPPPPPVIFTGGGGGGPSGPTPSEIEFEWNVTRDIEELDRDHGDATGAWSDGTTLWIAENGDGADDAVYAYDLESGERVEDLEFELDDGNLAPRGLWSDRSTIWVSDSGKDKLFAHDLASGERLPDADLALHRDNDDPRGIWSDGSTMWVLDDRDNALFAYDLATGELLAEYALDDDNDDPHGIWSDRVSVWVSDHNDKRLFAYRLPEAPDGPAAEDADALPLERVTDEEFTRLSRASNNSPRGLWSDGDVMYVVDASDGKVYTHNMPDAIDARLASLTLSGVEFGEFSSSQTEYEGVAGEGVTETTVTVEAEQRPATVAIDPADSDEDADGDQVALDGLEEITITVTSADGSRTKAYLVRFGDTAEEQPVAACLRGAATVGFSLLVYGGGSVDDLDACAQIRGVTAFYVPHEGEYVPYILGAPEFVNEAFVALYADGLPSLTPLIAKSDGPPSADPAAGEEVTDFGLDCLRGAIASGFSLVLYDGGSVADVDACAASRNVSAVYALVEGEYVPYILGAPDFVNEAFRELFPEGLAPVTPLVAKRG